MNNPSFIVAPRQSVWLVRLGAIVLLAVGLRLWGIDFGLPYFYHADEPDKVSMSLNMIKTGDLNPKYFRKPTLQIYLNTVAYWAYYEVGRLKGTFNGPDDLPLPEKLGLSIGRMQRPEFFLIGRLMSVLFGTLAVALAFWVGKLLTHQPAVGWLAAVFIAVSPTNVANSRYIAPESLSAFLLLLALGCTIHVMREGRMRDYVLAGVACGLVASAKYNGALIGLTLLGAHFLRTGWKGWRDGKLYAALLSGALAFFATTPFALLDFSKFLSDFTGQAEAYATGHVGMEGNTLGWYIAYLGTYEGLVVIWAVIEMARGLYRRDRPVLLTMIFPLAYFVFVNVYVVRNDRLILPLLPFLFLLAAMFLHALYERLQAHEPGKMGTGLITVVAMISIALPLGQSVKGTIEFTRLDSRETARGWLEQNLPPGAHVALESYAPFIDPERFAVQTFFKLTDYPADWYRDQGFDYLVFSEGMYDRFFQDPERYTKDVGLYEDLFKVLEPVQLFTDGGYEIRIYRVPRH